MLDLNENLTITLFFGDTRYICKVTPSLGLLLPHSTSFSGIRKVMKFY
jgi:hypothetical protein